MSGKRRDGLEGKPRVDGKQVTRDFSAYVLGPGVLVCFECFSDFTP